MVKLLFGGQTVRPHPIDGIAEPVHASWHVGTRPGLVVRTTPTASRTRRFATTVGSCHVEGSRKVAGGGRTACQPPAIARRLGPQRTADLVHT